MKTNKELYAIAKAQIGNGGAEFRKYVGIGKGEPYCDAFVYWLFNANGCGELLPWKGLQRSYCPSSIQWCNKNLALIPPYLAMQCDIIYFDWEKNGTPNHIGIVTAKKDTVTIYTLEGNTTGKIKGKAVSGIVFEKTRTTAYVQGVYRPHFKGSFKIGKIDEDGNFEYNSIANLQVALKMSFVDGILGKATVKALQKRAGVTQDGAWGKNTSKAVQKLVGATADGEFGPASVKALQRWINRQNGAAKISSPSTPVKPAPKPEPRPVVTASTYSGEFPDLVIHSGQKIAYTGIALAYPKGTPKKTYTYGKGRATLAFQKAINTVYPKRTSWSAQCRAGASCDVGAGTTIRYSGYDTTIPRGLQEQIPHLQKSTLWKKTGLTKTSQMKAGDVGIYIGKRKGSHIWIGIGNKKIVEANHTAKYFLHVDTDNYTSSGKKTWGIYRACTTTPIGNGDKGTEVKKLQAFLNWAGFGALATDGEVGSKTLAAIKAFQKANALTVDGEFGVASLIKAKAVKR